MIRRILLALLTLLASCSPPQPAQPQPRPVAAAAPNPVPPPAAPIAAPQPSAVIVPPDAAYVCRVERPGGAETTVIDLSVQVAALCRKNPEMGPCKYERDACRRNGGSVFAAEGEITPLAEAEYDKRVLRVRLRGD